MSEQIEFDRVALLHPEDGDVLVLRTNTFIGPAHARNIREQVRAMFAPQGKNVQVLILDPGIDLALVTDERSKRIRAIIDE